MSIIGGKKSKKINPFLAAWRKHVQRVADEKKISYREAMRKENSKSGKYGEEWKKISQALHKGKKSASLSGGRHLPPEGNNLARKIRDGEETTDEVEEVVEVVEEEPETDVLLYRGGKEPSKSKGQELAGEISVIKGGKEPSKSKGQELAGEISVMEGPNRGGSRRRRTMRRKKSNGRKSRRASRKH